MFQLLGGGLLPLVQHVQSRIHIIRDLVELLAQLLHDFERIIVSAMREMVGLSLRSVKNCACLLACELSDVLLTGKELRLSVGLFHGVCSATLRGSNNRICLSLCALQAAFGLAHER